MKGIGLKNQQETGNIGLHRVRLMVHVTKGVWSGSKAPGQ